MDPFKPYQPRPRNAPPARPDSSQAEAIALQAIAWIAADQVMMERFLALTGCGHDGLKSRLSQPAFLGGVLDFILGDEATLLAFVTEVGLDPEIPMLARGRLP